MTPPLWLARVSGVLLFLLLACSCRAWAQMVDRAMLDGGQTQPVDQPVSASITYAQLANYIGITFCTERGAFSLVASDLSEIEEADTEAHEAKHREQFARFKNCRAFQRWYMTPRGKLDAETEAFHAGWCIQIAMGADPVSLRQLFVERIERYLGGTANRLEIVQRFASYGECP